MSRAAAVPSPAPSKAGRAILWAGLIAGTLDITAACVTGYARRGTSPVTTLQSVASGLLGPGAFEGGGATAALGLLLHFVIAFTAAAVFYLASRKLRFLVEQPWISGPLYGIAVYFFMNLVVVPLSSAPFKIPINPVGLLIHVFCVGLPIALAVRRHSV